MLDDPLRAQSVSLVVGCVLAVVAVVGGLVLAAVRPGSDLGDAPILISSKSGALYAQLDGVVHPVLNLASARLVARSAATPEPVSDAALAAARRGPLIGIPGAPHRIDPPLTGAESGWTLCDTAKSGETVLHIGRAPGALLPFAAGAARLVVPRDAGPAATYLLFDGIRAAVDLRDIAVVRALRLEGIVPQPVARSLLDSVPEVPAVAAPVVTGPGGPGPAALGGAVVGTVLRLVRSDVAEFYVVLPGGLQRISRVAADLVRFTVPQASAAPPDVTADTVARIPIVADLDVGPLPETVASATTSVLCVGWDPSHLDPVARTTLYEGNSLEPAAVELAQRDGADPKLDGITIAPGRSVLARSSGLLDVDGATPGTLYLIDDRGVRYGLQDIDTATHLGLTRPAVAGPWPMLAMLPRGPELSREAASIVRDGLDTRGPAS